MIKNTKIVNFVGKPSSGKTNLAYSLSSSLKQRNYDFEYVDECVKFLIYEESILSTNQIYILSEQLKKILCLYGKVDYIICDSPLFLSTIYAKDYLINNIDYPQSFDLFVLELFNKFNNEIILVDSNFEYVQKGRNENANDANLVQDKIKSYLNENNLIYHTYNNELSDIYDYCIENKIIF